MATRSKWELPLVIDPPETVCFQVHVPKEKYYIAAFLGAIYELGTWYAWQRDPAHSGKQVANKWRKIWLALRADNCPPTQTGPGADGDEQMIRQNPSNPCELQTSIDGTTWCTFADLSKCIPAGSQPGDGSPQPPNNGGIQCYHGQMPGNSQFLVPANVSTGDVLHIENLAGACSDAPLGPWTCPAGDVFVLGNCVPNTGGPSGGDPLNTAKHGAIIVNINGTWYDITAGDITVPGGVSSLPAVLQMNDSDISDNNGSYTFDVCVTNNQPGTFSHVFDFTTGLHTWVIQNLGNSGEPAGVFVPGSGIDVTDFPRGGVVNVRGAAIQITLPSRGYTNISYKINYAIGGFDSGTVTAEDFQLDGTDRILYLFNSPPVQGTGVVLSQGVTDAGVTVLFAQIRVNSTAAAPTGSGRIVSVEIQGIGTDPAMGL